MERGAWRATAHGVAESRTRLKVLSTENKPAVTDGGGAGLTGGDGEVTPLREPRWRWTA